MRSFKQLPVVVLVLLFSVLAIPVSSQMNQTIWYQYCTASPDSSCFVPLEGQVDSVGRDVGALGGTFRICLELDTIDSGYAPVRVVLVLDRSGSMCNGYGDNCCTEGDGSGNCANNDPTNQRVVAATAFVDSLRALNPLSEVGVITYVSSVSSRLNPLPLSSDANIERIKSAIAGAGCTQRRVENDRDEGGIGKVAGLKETNLGVALEAGLQMVDYQFEDMSPFMSRHIILLTDGAWDDIADKPPATLYQTYQTEFQGRGLPTVHGIFLSDSALHVAHGYPVLGCAENSMIDVTHLQTAVSQTQNGIFFPNATPQTIVAVFKTILDSVTQTAPQALTQLVVTNAVNNETRTNASKPVQLGSTPTWEATLDNLPVEFGSNPLTFQVTITNPDGTTETRTTHVNVIRSERYREAIDTDLFNEYCELVNASISIKVTPDNQPVNTPFNVESRITNASNFTLDTIQVRVFTAFPDNGKDVFATFHLDGNLKNATDPTGLEGLQNPSVGYSGTDYLFGSEAMNSGSFYYTFPQMNDFIIEEWIRPGSRADAKLFEGGGITIGVNTEGKVYVSAESGVIVTSLLPVDQAVWSHIAVLRTNGQLTLFVNGMTASETVAFATPVTAGPMNISDPSMWVVDEVRISTGLGDRVFVDGATVMLSIPTLANPAWNLGSAASNSEMLKVPPSSWTGGSSLDFTFSSPVDGRVLINFRQKQNAGPGTGWSKNGNPVMVGADKNGPYILTATLNYGSFDEKDQKRNDLLVIKFNEMVNCATLFATTPSTAFLVSRIDSNGTVHDRPDLLQGATYEGSCGTQEYVDSVVISVRPGIMPNSDSIRINSDRIVDANGNPAQKDKKTLIELGTGGAPEIQAVQTETPMYVDQIISQIYGIEPQPGKIILIESIIPLDTKTSKVKIYDVVGTIVAKDLPIKKSSRAGIYYIIWDGHNTSKRRVGKGAYLAVSELHADKITAKGSWTKTSKFHINWKK